jgi:hypothetical protein
MKKYVDVVINYLKEKFGSSIAEQLIKRELKNYGLNSISEIDTKSQVSFFENFMKKRYSQFLSKEEVDSRIMQLNLHYCSLIAADKISKDIKNKIIIQPFEIKFQHPNTVISKAKKLIENSIYIEIKITGDISAESIFFFSEKDAITISQIMSSVFGKTIKEETIDKTIIKKFLETILPNILNSAKELLGNSISFTFIEGSKDSLISDNSLNKGLVFFSEVPLKLNSEDLSFNVMVMLKK